MRRRDREVTARGEMLDIMRRCDVCYVSFMDEHCPYTVPMNFGVETDGDDTALYFHCAGEGRKLELLRRNPQVSFAMSCAHRFEGSGISSTMRYESVCGNGRMSIVGMEEKPRGLNAILANYGQEPMEAFPERAIEAVCVLRLTISEMTGKRNAR